MRGERANTTVGRAREKNSFIFIKFQKSSSFLEASKLMIILSPPPP
jgi:hypothetical protein